ncbi:MAG: hypothetical protein IPL61_32925 [Myxococcales bacterium]|nr:hypothetical protein [Myxococcales bacterium]
MILTWILGLAIAGANIGCWWYVVIPGERRFVAWVERRYQVQIARGMRGHWRVTGPGSKIRLFLIELLQLAYFMGAMVVWSAAMLIAVVALTLLHGR